MNPIKNNIFSIYVFHWPILSMLTYVNFSLTGRLFDPALSSLGIHDYILRAAMNHQAANAYAFSLVSFLETIILYIHL